MSGSAEKKKSVRTGVFDIVDRYREMELGFQRRFLFVALLLIPLIGTSPAFKEGFGYQFTIFQGYESYVLALIPALIVFIGGMPFFAGAFREMMSHQYSSMTLISVALLLGLIFSLGGAFGYVETQFHLALGILVLALIFGYWIGMKIVRSASFGVREILHVLPEKVQLVKAGGGVELELSRVQTGEKVRVQPDELIPVDGVIESGQAHIDSSLLMGDSPVVIKKAGDEVIAGMRPLDGVLTVRVDRVGETTVLASIMRIIRASQEMKPNIQEAAEQLARYGTLVTIVIAISSFLYWTFMGTHDIVFAFVTAIAVLVTASPYALEIAVPVVTAVVSSLSIKKGIILKDTNIVEKAKDIEFVLFDKTGILTQGEFRVTEIVPLSVENESEIIRLAAALESNSMHPVGIAIVKEAMARTITFGVAEGVDFHAGKGITGRVMGHEIIVGTTLLLQEKGIDSSTFEKEFMVLNAKKRNVVWVAREKEVIGLIGCADETRDDAKKMVAEIKELGITPVMLTGDGYEVAEWVAKEVGIERYHAEVLPEDKARIVSVLQREILRRRDGNTEAIIAMVGDGINDAAALKQADIGIAIGVATDLEKADSADIIFTKKDLRDIAALVRLSQRASSKLGQNVFLAAIYNLIALPLAAGVLAPFAITLSPELGALFMSVSALLIALNALTLRRV